MIKINNLEIENVKRVKAFKLEPSESGLTIIGGKNGQGKTSVLDAIAWALGGDKFKPSQAMREGSMVPPILNITMSNGFMVERKGVNSSLKVTDPQGNKGGQQLLNEFVEQMALNLPKFMAASNKEKASILLQIIGVEEQLKTLEKQETQIYNRRTEIGRIADQKTKFAAEMTNYPEAPKELISASELIKKHQNILGINGENERKRQNVESIARKAEQLKIEIKRLSEQLRIMIEEHYTTSESLIIAKKTVMELQDENTTELEKNIANIDEINIKVRANYDKEKAEIDAAEYKKVYEKLTEDIEKIREDKNNLLKNANLPLAGLFVDNGDLSYNGYKWDNMSGAEQLKVATAIVRKLNPNCGFVLMDKLEQMDTETLQEFGEWLEKENLQVVATRVSSGDECSVIIEDGYVKDKFFESKPEIKNRWEAGKF